MSNLLAHLRAMATFIIFIGSVIFFFAFPEAVITAVLVFFVLFWFSLLYAGIYVNVNKKKED